MVHIIIDASGSMQEGGKKDALRVALLSVLHTIAHIEEGCEVKQYYWNDEITTPGDGKEVSFKGKTDANLAAEIKRLIGDAPALLLTDGIFDEEVKKKLTEYFSGQITPVYIGADADIDKLKKISANGTVFCASEAAQVPYEILR